MGDWEPDEAPKPSPLETGWEVDPVAHPEAAHPKATLGESRARGAFQGLTAGYGDELSAGLAAALPFLDREAAQGETLGERYRHARDFYRGLNKQAHDDNPGNYTASEVGGGLVAALSPVGRLLAPAKGAGLATTLLKGGMQGGLTALGGSNADLTRGEVGQAALDTTAGVGTGMAFSGLGYRLGKFGQKAADEVRLANADSALKTARLAEKADRAATGAYGGEVAAVLNKAKSLEHALTSNLSTAEQKAAAEAQLASPEFQGLYQNALQGNLDLTAQQMGGRLLNAKAAMETARAARAPEAIEKAAAESMANPIRRQVLPKLQTYATRALPLLVGHQVGGWPGVAAGGMVSAVMGAPGTAFANLVKHPGTRAAFWSALGGLTDNALAPAARHSIVPASLELAPEVAAQIAALRRRPSADFSTWTPETP